LSSIKLIELLNGIESLVLDGEYISPLYRGSLVRKQCTVVFTVQTAGRDMDNVNVNACQCFRSTAYRLLINKFQGPTLLTRIAKAGYVRRSLLLIN